MEIIKAENLSFSYPNRETKALDSINLIVNQGEFVTICGKSGCGKTTFLKLLKSTLAPYGNLSGKVYFKNKELSEYDAREQSSQIGFVMQNPDNQIVTDKVWHELAFGLESLGYSTPEIRTRVSEMASFFGIQTWFHKSITELSGGQKQLLNLASVMVMQPSVLILDEPTSQLDPISSREFLKTLERINHELGTTIILTEHRLEEVFSISHKVVVMDGGKIIAQGTPKQVGDILKTTNHDMYRALPTPMRIYAAVENNLECPLTVRDGRIWLEEYSKTHKLCADSILRPAAPEASKTAIELKDVWFRYDKNLPDVIKGMNLQIHEGELFAMVGGNGTGKTTALNLISGLNKAYRGTVKIGGKSLSDIKDLYGKVLGVLPQNPQALFVKNTVYQDLLEMLEDTKLSADEKHHRITQMSALCRIQDLLQSHPYDLSGGEQQRAALAKVLLKSPEILLLDEATKGMDAHFKEEFAQILRQLTSNGVTVVMVSHDIEFCAEYVDRCALVFDGGITSVDTPAEFFAGKSFYTTAANRMSRTRLPGAVLAEDVIAACGGKVPEKKKITCELTPPKESDAGIQIIPHKKRSNPARIVFGCLFAVLFLLTNLLFMTDADFIHIGSISTEAFRIIAVAEIAGAFFCLFPQKELGAESVQMPQKNRKLAKRTLAAALLILLAIPLTILIGVYGLGDRKYYFISLLIILETMLPFGMIFESRKPQARELVVISVLCAIAVAGRSAFFALPQFKPVVALVIISGVCFGGEAGFLVGAITGFVSNFFFGQGSWTPWQMFAFGIIGFLGGILFRKGFLRKTRISLCVFGFIATVVIYGIIMNVSSVITAQPNPNMSMIIVACSTGFVFDIIHAASTVFFLWFISEPMIEKLDRIKVKYGLIQR